MEQTRAAVYVRVSSAHQEKEGASLETQESECRRYAAQQGWSVDEGHVYRETHKRWTLHERPEMTKLRAAAKRREFDVVVCYCVDRLSSKDAHVYILDEEFTKAEVTLAFVTEQFEDTAIGRFVRSAKVLAAAIEVEKITERTVRGRLSRVQDKGLLIPGGKPPYGYLWAPDVDSRGKLVKGRLVIDPATAPVVQRIFRDIAAGTTLGTLVARLNREQVATPTGRGTVWHASTVVKMLHKPTYKGEAFAWGHRKKTGLHPQYFDPEKAIRLAEGTIPALVETHVWDAVQSTLTRNKARAIRSAKNPENALLRGGYIKCGYWGHTGRARPKGRGGAEYVCSLPARVKGGCTGHAVSAHILDAAVWDKVERVLLKPETIAAQVEKLRSEDPTEGQLEAVARAVAEVERQQANLARVMAQIDDPDASAPLVAQLKTLRQRQQSLREEQDMLLRQREAWKLGQQNLTDLESWCGTVAANMRDFSYDQKRFALDALGVSIILYRADHDPRWTITMAIQPQLVVPTT